MILAAGFDAVDGVILGVVVLLVGFSAVLALAETSLVRMTRSRAKALVDEGHRGARSLLRLAEAPERFLSPILLMVLVCQLVAATLVGVVAGHLFGPAGVAVATVFEVTIIFVAGEAAPKNWAVRHADRAALFAAPIVTSVIRLAPVRWASAGLIWLSRLVTPGGDEDQIAPDVTESELLAMADFAVDEDVIETEERALIHSIIEFGDTIVREVMVPRTDLVAVDGSVPAGEALGRAIDAGFSRIPVYNGNIDDVVGIAYTKDLIRATREGREQVPVREVVRGAPYVPETKRVAPLMREMQSERVHIAIVIDEYGGTAGVVTLEDLIEELVGEIADEYDLDEPLVERVSEHEYRISARMPVDEVNELLQVSLPVGDWDSVGGLVLHLLGHIPLEGEAVDAEGHRLTAERVQGRRIGRVRIGSVADPIAAPAEDALGAGRDVRHGR